MGNRAARGDWLVGMDRCVILDEVQERVQWAIYCDTLRPAEERQVAAWKMAMSAVRAKGWRLINRAVRNNRRLDGADIYQDACIEIVRNLKRWAPKEHEGWRFKGYAKNWIMRIIAKHHESTQWEETGGEISEFVADPYSNFTEVAATRNGERIWVQESSYSEDDARHKSLRRTMETQLAIRSISDRRERTVLIDHMNGVPQKETARKLGVSQSRVSQIRARAQASLAEHLQMINQDPQVQRILDRAGEDSPDGEAHSPKRHFA